MSKVGQLLREAREQQGLTLGQVEAALRIRRDYLEALETENFEALPAPVYARGFLATYARHLGLDPDEVLGLYGGKAVEPQLHPISNFLPPPRRIAPALAVIAMLGVLSLAAIYIYSRGLPPQTGALAIEVSTPTPTTTPPPTPVTTPTTPTAGQPSPSPRPASSQPSLPTPITIPGSLPGPGLAATPTASPTRRPPSPTPTRQPTPAGAGPTAPSPPPPSPSATPIPMVSVPSVIGVTLSVAEQTLTAAGLQAIPQDAWNPRLPHGMIYAQDPAPGTEVPVGSKVTITLNSQPGLIP